MTTPVPTTRALYDNLDEVTQLLDVAQIYGDERAISAARKLMQAYGAAILERAKIDPEGDRAEYVRRHGTN